MRALSVSLVLGLLLTLTRAAPVQNGTGAGRYSGLCEYENSRTHLVGTFVPQCDAYGNFLPQQCWASTGSCWCVNTVTGEMVPNTITYPGTTPIYCGSEYYCPRDWTRFGKHCFIFIDSKKTWTEAEAYCLFEEANLASVHSADENHFLQGLTRADTHDFPMTWIGGYDAIYMNYWMWTDGYKFEYENWAVDYEPDKMKSCLTMNHGYQKKWINNACNRTLPFVCAKMI